MNNKKILIFMLILLLIPILSAPIANAADFRVHIDPIKDLIYATESAIFNITITNIGDNLGSYKINSDVIWDLMSDPLPDYFSGMNIEAGESQTTTMMFSPPSKITTGAKKIYVDIENKEEEQISTPIIIYIQDTGYSPQGYIPFVMTTLVVEPTKINPNEKIVAKVKLKNGNMLNLTDVSIELSTENGAFYKQRIVNLDPREEISESFVITLDPLTTAGPDVLIASVSYDDSYFKPAKENIEIIPFSSLEENESSSYFFLKTDTALEITNDGNVAFNELYKIKTSIFKSLFINSNPNSKLMSEDGKRYLVWELNLNPGEKITIDYTENYRPFFAILLILIIGTVLYFVLRSKVVISKIAEVIETEEGGISKIKLTLNVKNRCKEKIEHIKVIEKVPNIAELIKEDYLGTLKPSKILKHDVKGMLLKWDISELEGYEERMITYKVKSKLSILGRMHLTPAVIKFKNPNGKITITHSNRYNLNI